MTTNECPIYRFTITDNGIGFDEATVKYVHGIENMKKRSKNFKGNYTIRSVPGDGTNVLLTIPLT